MPGWAKKLVVRSSCDVFIINTLSEPLFDVSVGEAGTWWVGPLSNGSDPLFGNCSFGLESMPPPTVEMSHTNEKGKKMLMIYFGG